MNFVLHFCLHFFGMGQARAGKMQKKKKQSSKRTPAKMQEQCKPGNRGQPKCKTHASLETDTKKQAWKPTYKNASLETSVSRLARVLHFGWPRFPGLHCSCILAGVCFELCFFFAFCRLSLAQSANKKATRNYGSRHANNATATCKKRQCKKQANSECNSNTKEAQTIIM